jgi:ferredoxin-NADP reductase
MAMLRHRAASAAGEAARLIYSSRSWEDVIYRDELERLAAQSDGLEVIHTLTRSQPPGWNGYARRIDAQMLADTAFSPGSNQLTYICGPTSFVEAAARALVLLGHEAKRIKTERFGSTAGSICACV